MVVEGVDPGVVEVQGTGELSVGVDWLEVRAHTATSCLALGRKEDRQQKQFDKHV